MAAFSVKNVQLLEFKFIFFKKKKKKKKEERRKLIVLENVRMFEALTRTLSRVNNSSVYF